MKLRFNLSANNNPLFLGYYKYLYRPKKGSISEFLNKYSLAADSKFTVVQIGANDGISRDPIHKYIKRDKWQGVLLEPQPYVYEKFLSRIYANNKGIHTVCAALGEKDGKRTLYEIGFSKMRWATGLASFSLENVEKAYTSGLVQDRCKRHGLKIPDAPEERISTEEVDVICAKTLLTQFNIKKIDLLQIDAEGYDHEIIRIFKIKKTQPKAIIFENFHLSKEDEIACNELLEKNDYAWKKYGSNTLAMKRPLGNFDVFLY